MTPDRRPIAPLSDEAWQWALDRLEASINASLEADEDDLAEPLLGTAWLEMLEVDHPDHLERMHALVAASITYAQVAASELPSKKFTQSLLTVLRAGRASG